MVAALQSSGVGDFDALLGGLISGDNIVWSSDAAEVVRLFEDRFLAEAERLRQPCCYVTLTTSPAAVHRRLGPNIRVLGGRARSGRGDPAALEQAIVEFGRERAVACVVVEGLEVLADRWGRTRAATFFGRTCPQLFDCGAIAYWHATPKALGRAFLDRITKITQCVFEVGDDYLRILKAEGRPAVLQGQLVRLEVDGDRVQLGSERVLGRLGSGLARLRQERNLSQADLARVAGVTPSAISQAEAGRRGLSLETVVEMCDRLGVGLDALLSSATSDGYLIARHDRSHVDTPITGLLDDPKAGLRAYLIRLAPGAQGAPPVAHKGVELVLVASGLVQLDIGSETPVMRAGDAALVTQAAVSGWHNLSPRPAVLFWILRD